MINSVYVFLAKVNFVISCKTKFFLSGTFFQLYWASCLLFAVPRAGNPSYVNSVTWHGRRLSYSSFIWRRGDIKTRRMPCMTEFEKECFYKLSGNRSKVVAKGHRWNRHGYAREIMVVRKMKCTCITFSSQGISE